MSGTETLSRLKSSKCNEWYTPEEHLRLIRTVLRTIDLDPASNSNNTTGARTAFTEVDGDKSWQPVSLGGLPWIGNTYCNPPYGGLAGKFAYKMLQEYGCGRVTSGILCLSGYAYETRWFRPILVDINIPICWVHGRVSFVKQDGTRRASTVGTVYVYLGSEPEIFKATFGQIGTVR